MSEVELIGLAGVGIIAMFLVVRAFIGKGRTPDKGDLVSVDGESRTE